MGKYGYTLEHRVTINTDTNIYAAGDAVGTLQSIPYAVVNQSGYIQSAVVIDAANQSPAIDFLLFNAAPTAAITNNAAFTPAAADIAKLLGFIRITGTDYASFGAGSPVAIAEKTLPKAINLTNSEKQTLYILAYLRSGTPTFTASALTLILNVMQD